MDKASEQYIQGLEAQIKRMAAESQWISVSERLPEENEYVFTIKEDTEIINACWFHKGLFECTESGNNVTDQVTHWMPLPKVSNK